MADPKTYQGGCHCGEVRYEATADLSRVIACNCSICQKHGLLLTFIPAADFKLLSGETALSDYQFNKKRVHHLFCRTCGTESFARGSKPDGTQMIAVNVRCLDGVDAAGIEARPFDGRSL
jgi:hypothetical protein